MKNYLRMNHGGREFTVIIDDRDDWRQTRMFTIKGHTTGYLVGDAVAAKAWLNQHFPLPNYGSIVESENA